MQSHDFQSVFHAQPFCPSSFAIADGATYSVDAPEDAWLAPDGKVVVVSAPAGVVLVGIEWITLVAFAPYPPGLTGQSERLMELKRADPFVPFEIDLADGRRFVVESADHIMIPRGGSTVIVADQDGLALLDSDQLAEIPLISHSPGVKGRVERLRKLRLAEPSAPLVLHLADGRQFSLTAAERMVISPDGRTVDFFEGQSFEIVYADQITDIDQGRCPRRRERLRHCPVAGSERRR